jgi:hypothetical protein
VKKRDAGVRLLATSNLSLEYLAVVNIEAIAD